MKGKGGRGTEGKQETEGCKETIRLGIAGYLHTSCNDVMTMRQDKGRRMGGEREEEKRREEESRGERKGEEERGRGMGVRE